MRRKAAVSGTLFTTLALGLLFAWGARKEAAPPADEPTMEPPARTAPFAVTKEFAAWDAPVPDVPEELARRSCVGDLLALDAMPGLDGVRAAFARGLPAGDPIIETYLRATIAARIGDDVDAALAILAWAKAATPDEAVVLLGGLAQSAGAKDPRVARALLELSTDAAGDERVRLAALDAVRAQPRLDDAERGALKALVSDDASEAVAWHATRALGQVMGASQEAGDTIEPYLDDLMDIAKTSGSAGVRALALEAPMHADTILPGERAQALVDLMIDEPHRDVRELAVFQLGLTSSPNEALEAFRQAFDNEYDVCVRAAIVRFAVRAAGEGAMPLLEHFARVDPVFVDDVADFRALFAQGFQDFEEIWLRKPERHACVVDDGEPHGGAL